MNAHVRFQAPAIPDAIAALFTRQSQEDIKLLATVSAGALSSSLAAVSRFALPDNTIPILNHVRIRSHAGAVIVTATDLDAVADSACDHHAKADDLDLCLNAKMLAGLLKGAAPDTPVTIAKADDWRDSIQGAWQECHASVSIDGAIANMTARHPKDWPAEILPRPAAWDVEMELSAPILADLLSVADTASTEETRYYLNGIYLCMEVTGGGANAEAHLVAVATDGHRLKRIAIPLPEAMADRWRRWKEAEAAADAATGSEERRLLLSRKESLETGWLIPSRTIAGLRRAIPHGSHATDKLKARQVTTVTVRLCSTLAEFVVGQMTVRSKLIDGTFPDYRRIVPHYTLTDATVTKITVSRKLLIDAIKRLKSAIANKNSAVRLDSRQSELALIVSYNNEEVARIALPAITLGRQLTVSGFNMDYLRAAAEQLHGDDFSITRENEGAPSMLSGSDDRLTYLLMPMRV